MPRAVIETGNADRVLPVGAIAKGIAEVLSGAAC
jgi:chemotaxis response regulator CheB